MVHNVLFTQLIYDIRKCKVSNLRKPLSSLYLMQKDKSHKINTINYYIFFENICIYACFAYFAMVKFITMDIGNLIAVFERKLAIQR